MKEIFDTWFVSYKCTMKWPLKMVQLPVIKAQVSKTAVLNWFYCHKHCEEWYHLKSRKMRKL